MALSEHFAKRNFCKFCIKIFIKPELMVQNPQNLAPTLLSNQSITNKNFIPIHKLFSKLQHKMSTLL